MTVSRFWPALRTQRGPRLASGLYPALDEWCWSRGSARLTFCQSTFGGHKLSMQQKCIEEVRRQLETGETTPEIELGKLDKFLMGYR